jgi:pimeloyl-ACP methyl ester carboxylesterase
VEKFVKADGLTFWSEDFGDSQNPTVLLIAGGSSQGVHWPDDFCAALAARGTHVIRWDARDTGLSSRIDFDKTPYTLADMGRDAGLVLDGWGVDKAHVVGSSMGGMIAQEFTLQFPERTLSLTSWMSSPVGGTSEGSTWTRPELPTVPDNIKEYWAACLANPPQTMEERIEVRVQKSRLLHGTAVPFDADLQRAVAQRESERAVDYEANPNHELALGRSADRTQRLGSVTAPTLVIYGTADPIAGLGHAEATVAAVPGAQIFAVEGVGHEMPHMRYDFSHQIVDRILDHVFDGTGAAAAEHVPAGTAAPEAAS